MNDDDMLKAFGALSQETRLRMMRYIVKQGEKGAPAGEISQAVGVAFSRTSFHLSTLERAGIVSSKRQSRHIIYRANIANLARLASFLLNDCCDGHPDVWNLCRADKSCV